MIHRYETEPLEILAILTRRRSTLSVPDSFPAAFEGDELHLAPIGQPEQYLVLEITGVFPLDCGTLLGVRRPPVNAARLARASRIE